MPRSASGQERCFGTDISYWNCGTSSTGISQDGWNTAYSSGGVRFVWLRASRGGTTGVDESQGTPGGGSDSTLSRRYDDSRFTQNLARAVNAGILVGSYHFSRPDIVATTAGTGGVANTGTDEADHFIQMAGAWMRPGYMMPIHDLEAGQSQRTANELAQFCIDFSDRIYEVMKIRPAIYINGSYSGTLQSSSASLRDALAKPGSYSPGLASPAYPMLWNARYADNSNPGAIPIQTGSPKHTYTTISSYYGPWDDYGDTDPWSFWQYASTVSIPGIADSTLDANISHGDLEYVLNYLTPAVWWHDSSGTWNTLSNWNSGQVPVAPVLASGQATPYGAAPLPVPRLPGATSTNMTSGRYDTVIIERPNADITVTFSGGNYTIRKLYMREQMNITSGTLQISYDPTYRADDSPNVLHAGPVSAQFSGPVTMSGGTLNVHTLQVDAGQFFTNSGGTLTVNRINLMPHSTTPAKMFVLGTMTLNARSNVIATIARGAGSGTFPSIDLGGGTRTFSVVNGTNDMDLSVEVPIANGGLTKTGSGTMQLTSLSTYAGGTTISNGRLFVNNTSGSGTGSGAVAVNGGTLGGTGIISGAITLASAGTLAPGTPAALGTMTLHSAPFFNGTNLMRINRNGGVPVSDRIALTGGSFNFGGSLVVTNVGAALTGGETFLLFSGPAYSGAFQSMTLPPLNAGLNWFTGAVTTNGTIRVNRAPVAGAHSFTNAAPAVLEIPFSSLISGATDADGNSLSVTGINLTTTNGTTLTTNSTSIFYSHHASVQDQFTYTLSDGHGGTATGVVNITNIGSTPSAQFSTSPSANGSSVLLSVQGTAGWTYYLDRSTNLIGWVTISTNVAPQNGTFNVTDSFGDLGAPPSAAYYRLRW